MPRKRNRSPQSQAVLAALLAKPSKWTYGYALSKETGLKSGTLYPILMRLHDQGFLEDGWRDSGEPGRPPRHIYRLTPQGVDLAREVAPSNTGVARRENSAEVMP